MYRCTTRIYISSTYTKRCRERVCGRLAYSQSVSQLVLGRSRHRRSSYMYNIILYDECVPDLAWRASDSDGTTWTTDATEYRVAGPYTEPIGGDTLSSTYYYIIVIVIDLCVCVRPMDLSEHHNTSYSRVLLLLVIIIIMIVVYYVLFPSTLWWAIDNPTSTALCWSPRFRILLLITCGQDLLLSLHLHYTYI